MICQEYIGWHLLLVFISCRSWCGELVQERIDSSEATRSAAELHSLIELLSFSTCVTVASTGSSLLMVIGVVAAAVVASSRSAVATAVTGLPLTLSSKALVACSCIAAIGATGRSRDSNFLDLMGPLTWLLLLISCIAVALGIGIGRWNLSKVEDIAEDGRIPIATSVFGRVDAQSVGALSTRLSRCLLLVKYGETFLLGLWYTWIGSTSVIRSLLVVILLHLDLFQEVLRSRVQCIVWRRSHPNCTCE